jgi:hypothetical protein
MKKIRPSILSILGVSVVVYATWITFLSHIIVEDTLDHDDEDI